MNTASDGRERRFVFGEVADLYDAARPGYPDEIIDAVLELAGLRDGGRALEVGAGTGRLTLELARHGLTVKALEPSDGMAAVVRRRCADLPGIEVLQSTFEEADIPPSSYDLVTAAQSWHWVDPDVGLIRAAELLRPGGWIALLWNRPVDRGRAAEAIDDVYARLLPETGMVSQWAGCQTTKSTRDWSGELAGAEGFGDPVSRERRWTLRYTTEDYLRLMRTHSDHRLLDEGTREQLLREVGAAIDHHGGATTVTYLTELHAAPRR